MQACYDFQMEKKLKQENPQLHRIFSDNTLCCQNLLIRYKSFFPNYTDHTALHSLEVIAFCNELIGGNLERINTDEIFVLLMAIYLHDSGMGISVADYEKFSKQLPQVTEYRRTHPEADVATVIREFHNEFSGQFIRKYARLFDIPTEEHFFAIVQAARGHRKTDLYDETEYPGELSLANGTVIHVPYLAALIRLADELDIAADRNILFLYDLKKLSTRSAVMEYKKHLAIKKILFRENYLELYIDFSEPCMKEPLLELLHKLEETMDYCVKLIQARTPFEIKQTSIKIVKMNGTGSVPVS